VAERHLSHIRSCARTHFFSAISEAHVTKRRTRTTSAGRPAPENSPGSNPSAPHDAQKQRDERAPLKQDLPAARTGAGRPQTEDLSNQIFPLFGGEL
jgi:hypothetical protein